MSLKEGKRCDHFSMSCALIFCMVNVICYAIVMVNIILLYRR